ncbi:hypothetical protein RhiirA4_491400 [Rhizophagus irregularis]|uniref:Uncharacterized protein n=1 Tax=Rhizophagus irregularis TaxID=588596 RepID=A0A2I1HWD6_9GLOM|nr:hypothetical protein RhiirA4_489377 [Rhizophagus irregularis]PKY63211.1 hypothetical protein RhiirA4_491400 [Rhizophagus irregularis]
MLNGRISLLKSHDGISTNQAKLTNDHTFIQQRIHGTINLICKICKKILIILCILYMMEISAIEFKDMLGKTV